MSSSGAAARSDVICRLTHEMLDSIAWLHSNVEDDEELAGVLQIVDAADAHLGRMADRLRRRLTTGREAV